MLSLNPNHLNTRTHTLEICWTFGLSCVLIMRVKPSLWRAGCCSVRSGRWVRKLILDVEFKVEICAMHACTERERERRKMRITYDCRDVMIHWFYWFRFDQNIRSVVEKVKWGKNYVATMFWNRFHFSSLLFAPLFLALSPSLTLTVFKLLKEQI